MRPLLMVLLTLGAALTGHGLTAQQPSRDTLLAAARDIMTSADYAASTIRF